MGAQVRFEQIAQLPSVHEFSCHWFKFFV
jgi:hypothetical protein